MQETSDILRAHHIRVTPTTEQILQLLQTLHRPVTVEDIYLALKEQGYKSNLSTVYRTFERFLEKGILSKHAYMADGKSLYELAGDEHHHYFRCINCGQLWQVEACPLHDLIQELSDKLHIQVTAHKLELSGYCTECQKNADFGQAVRIRHTDLCGEASADTDVTVKTCSRTQK